MITSDTIAIGGILWFCALLIIWRWQSKYEWTYRGRGTTTYFPHISHIVSYMYLASTAAFIAIGSAISANHPGPLILLFWCAWLLRGAIKVSIGWWQQKSVTF